MSEGTGAAENAEITIVEETDVADAAAVLGEISDSDRAVLEDNVVKARAKIVQAEGHLAAAHVALATAEAELEGV